MPSLLGDDDDPVSSVPAGGGGLLGLVDEMNRTALGPLYVPREAGQTATVSAGAGPPALPPIPEGSVRLYHGGDNPTSGGGRWVTPNYIYARDYRPGQTVHYADVPASHPAVQKATDYAAVEGTNMRPPISSFEAPEDIAMKLKPVGR